MPFGAALPKGVELRSEEVAATFVVPAPNGCNLNCAFCVVRARREAKAGDAHLAVEDYLQFLEVLHAEFPLGLVSLQGYEPLLPESWGYSKAILKKGNELGLRTALITNGTHLVDHIDDLVVLDVLGLTVSLDSADPELHDATRRTPGAFAATIAGLRAALAAPPLAERVLVASVLQPDKRRYLDGMPALLGSLGVHKWLVTPMYKFTGSGFGGPVDSPESVVSDLLRLQGLARQHGVQLLVDDEFDVLTTRTGNVVSLAELQLRRMKRIDQVVRLSANGSFSIGQEILRRVGAGTPLWRPAEESAAAFVARTLRTSPEQKLVYLKRQTG